MSVMEKRRDEHSRLLNEAVDTLFSSHTKGSTLNRSIAERFNFELETGYRVQELVTERKIREKGERVRGYKISLTSTETQGWFGADEPAFGTLTDSNISNGTIHMSEMSEPLLETELMFHITEDIPHSASNEELLEKVLVAAGIEVPDSRFSDWFPRLSLGTITADNAVAGKIVAAAEGKKLSYESLGNIDLKLYLDGKEIAQGNSSEVLGNPLEALKWLVGILGKRGKYLEKGMVVSSGTLVLPLPLQRGTYRATYGLVGDICLEVL